ncbi:longitudinals lacking protein, isoforms H/M/V [Eurytemora carolleeae]|uniref:longitudinals lacking protein, isoforms H/M/V n=1 Tax=Eurytemora carolleeae TaxID=1294199 RepID=UPI000C769B12|nr:longitudinals lacking protein, isoforms H/M/V [Eurytemora carolleeae]|eukprot:XP_023344396.1 longitudinals lacking protein, isoforms H/M/V-like [Eurytemora affinis]
MCEEYLLAWNDHHASIITAMSELASGDVLTDVSVWAGETMYSAHRLVLALSSHYFRLVVTGHNGEGKHPVIFLKDVSSRDFERLLQYMYRGEVSVPQTELFSLISAAKSLGIRGLAEGDPSFADLEKSSGPSVSPKPDNKDKRESTDTDTLNLSKRPRYESGSDGSPPEPGRRAGTKDGNEERGSERKRKFTDASRNIGISMKENIENELGAEEQSSQKKQIIKVSEVYVKQEKDEEENGERFDEYKREERSNQSSPIRMVRRPLLFSHPSAGHTSLPSPLHLTSQSQPSPTSHLSILPPALHSPLSLSSVKLKDSTLISPASVSVQRNTGTCHFCGRSFMKNKQLMNHVCPMRPPAKN